MPSNRSTRQPPLAVDAQRANDGGTPGLRSSNRVHGQPRLDYNETSMARRASVPNTPNTPSQSQPSRRGAPSTPRTPIHRNRQPPQRQRTTAELSQLQHTADSLLPSSGSAQNAQRTTHPDPTLDVVMEERNSDSSDVANQSPSPEQRDCCPICQQDLEGPCITHARQGVEIHPMHEHCVVEYIKAHWTRQHALPSNFLAANDLGRLFLKCPTCRDPINSRDLITSGGTQFVVPKREFVNEIWRNLATLADVRNRRGHANIHLSRAQNLMVNFNILYHHERQPRTGTAHASLGGRDGYPFQVMSTTDLEAESSSGSFVAMKNRIENFLRESRLDDDDGVQELYRKLGIATTSGHRDLEPGLVPLPEQGQQPLPSHTTSRSRRGQQHAHLYQIAGEGNSSKFLVFFGGEWLEILYYQLVRLGGRFILAKTRRPGEANFITTQPLHKFASDVKVKFEEFCTAHSREPQFLTSVEQDRSILDRTFRINELKFVAMWNVGRIVYTAVRFQEEETWDGNLFNSWFFTASELVQIFNERHLIKEKMAAFRERQSLPPPPCRGASARPRTEPSERSPTLPIQRTTTIRSGDTSPQLSSPVELTTRERAQLRELLPRLTPQQMVRLGISLRSRDN